MYVSSTAFIKFWFIFQTFRERLMKNVKVCKTLKEAEFLK